MMRVGVGLSDREDAFSAGREAAIVAQRQAKETEADLVIVFASANFEQKDLLKGVISVTGRAPLLGCTGAGEITVRGVEKRAIAVMIVSSDKIEFATGLGEKIKENARAAGHHAAREAVKKGIKNRSVFMMLPDGLTGNGADIIRGVQEILGTSFPIVGGSAADEFLFERTFQYYKGEIFSNSVCGVLLGGDIAFGLGARHGWRPLGKHRKVTRAHLNRIEKIDNKPAVEIYEDYFEKDIDNLREPLARMAILYPLGMAVPGEEEYLVRNALRVEKDGSLVCVGEVPEGTEIRLMMSSKELVLEAARIAANEALKGMEGVEIKLAIIFNSISRNKLLGRMAEREIEVVREVLGRDVPIIGFYSYGEQAPLRAQMHIGKSYFHNESIVILAIGESR
jgi:hypothetical protein